MIDQAGEVVDYVTWPFYKTLPSKIKKWLLAEGVTTEVVRTMSWSKFKHVLLKVLNRELEYSRQDHYLSVRGLPDYLRTDA